jgi:spermidine/putrescine transport system substrate-binding protein
MSKHWKQPTPERETTISKQFRPYERKRIKMNAPRNSNNSPRNPRWSRRDFLIRSTLVGAGALSLPAFLAACGDDDGGSSSDTSGGGSKKLTFDNWPAYIDEETVAEFRAATGIDLRYLESYNDNNEYFAKVQPVLSKGNKIDADILAPTYWMAARYVQLGWAQKLPLDAIPNKANLRGDLVGPNWDKNGEYSLPWQTGTAGIAYNISATGREIRSVSELFNPEFKGRVGMLTEMRDTIGLILMGENIDPSSITTFDDAAPAFEKLAKAKADKQIRQFTGNDYMDDLSSGNFAVCVGWSGDILQLAKDNPDVRFVIPEEGGTSWYDSMIWVTGSENADSVAQWMNYVYDPVNAAKIAVGTGYMTPVEGVREVLEAMGGDEAEMANDVLLFPDDETLSRLLVFASLSEEEEAKFDEEFSKITGA